MPQSLPKLEAWSIFGDAATLPALELADRLSDLSSLDEAKIFLTTGGGDAIDTAAKLAAALLAGARAAGSAAHRQPHLRLPRDESHRTRSS